MPAILRQQYIDPNEGQRRIREIQIDVEIVRPDDMMQMNSIVQLRAEGLPHPHQPHLADFEPVCINPEDMLAELLDGRRTSAPPGCLRTQLQEESKSHIFVVEDIDALDIHKGDPVVVMNNLNAGNTKIYGLVKDFDANQLTIETSQEPCHFYAGAFIQNLANRWHPASNVLGAKTQLKRPGIPTFRTHVKEEGIEVRISMPLNTIYFRELRLMVAYRVSPLVALLPPLAVIPSQPF